MFLALTARAPDGEHTELAASLRWILSRSSDERLGPAAGFFDAAGRSGVPTTGSLPGQVPKASPEVRSV